MELSGALKPAGHGMHPMLPLNGLKVSAGQLVQLVDDVTFENEPAGHSTHGPVTPLAEKVPGLHGTGCGKGSSRTVIVFDIEEWYWQM